MPLSTHPAPLSRSSQEQSVLLALTHAAQPLTGVPGEWDELVAQLGTARYALMGESSHGTHDFYETRAMLTRQLIEHHGLTAVAIEGDWPDAWRVNRYVQGLPCPVGDVVDTHGAAALGDFQRFPSWMWRNTVVLEFVEWLRAYNEGLPLQERVGFYGMDLYSLFASTSAVLRYLDATDPAASERARGRYACFDHFRDNAQAYSYAAHFDMTQSCEDAVVAQLVELQRSTSDKLTAAAQRGKAGRAGAGDDADLGAAFHAAQNARVVRNAERYYRTMFGARVSSWNLRDQHMAETLDALDTHLQMRRDGRPPKIAVWAHNSHLGDARATEMATQGEINLGQLLRQRHGREVFSLGFTTYTGTVTAAAGWDAPAAIERVRPSLPDSTEALLHNVLYHASGAPALLLPLRGRAEVGRALSEPRLQRAIGVVYAPQTERQSHYFHARLPEQFDALVHIDTTRALEPLASDPLGVAGASAAVEELPDTFPSGS